MNDTQPLAFTPGRLWEVALRHKKKLILTPVVILLAAVAVILWAPRTYRSEAKLFLQVGRETVGLDPTATTGQTISLQQSGRDTEVVSAMDLVGSRSLLSQVVDQLGPEYVLRGGPEGEGGSWLADRIKAPLAAAIGAVKNIDPVSPHERAIIELEKNLTIDSERDSMVIVVRLDADSPVGAQKMLATLVGLYQQEHLRIHRNPESQTFFAEQRELLEDRLNAANDKLRQAKNRMGLASVEGRRATLEGQLRNIEESSYTTEQQLATALARLTDLSSQLGNLPERMVASRKSIPNQGADLLREQLYTLQMRQMDLLARYSEEHPLVIAIAEQVEAAKKIVEEQSDAREETVDDINPVHRQLTLELRQQQNQVAGYEARLKTLGSQKQLVHQDLRDLNRNEIELDELMREVSLARTKFLKYAENLEQARIDQELESQKISSVSVPQDATLAEKPVSPSKPLVGAGALLLAFGATVGWVFASEQVRPSSSPVAAERRPSVSRPVYGEVAESKLPERVLH